MCCCCAACRSTLRTQWRPWPRMQRTRWRRVRGVGWGVGGGRGQRLDAAPQSVASAAGSLLRTCCPRCRKSRKGPCESAACMCRAAGQPAAALQVSPRLNLGCRKPCFLPVQLLEITNQLSSAVQDEYIARCARRQHGMGVRVRHRTRGGCAASVPHCVAGRHAPAWHACWLARAPSPIRPTCGVVLA